MTMTGAEEDDAGTVLRVGMMEEEARACTQARQVYLPQLSEIWQDQRADRGPSYQASG